MPIFPSIEKTYATTNLPRHYAQQVKSSMHSKIHLPLRVDLCLLQNLNKNVNSVDIDGSHAFERSVLYAKCTIYEMFLT
jgi:hypothetical protein